MTDVQQQPQEDYVRSLQREVAWLIEDNKRLKAALTKSVPEIERLKKQVELLERKPDTAGCDLKCKDEDCYCGFRRWDAEYSAFLNTE